MLYCKPNWTNFVEGCCSRKGIRLSMELTNQITVLVLCDIHRSRRGVFPGECSVRGGHRFVALLLAENFNV